MSKESEYYKGLSELYFYRLENELKITNSMMIMQGCFMEMQSDLISYKINYGETDSLAKSIKRLDTVLHNFDVVSKIQTDNYILRELVKKQRREIEILENQLLSTVQKTTNEI